MSKGGQALACKKMVDDDEYNRYGVVAGTKVDAVTRRVETFVDKPGKARAPSDLASVSGYLLTPDIFTYIEAAASSFDGSGELMIQPMIQRMIDDGMPIYAREITSGTYYDTGDKLEYLKTVIDFGLMHKYLGPALRKHITTYINSEA